MVYDEDDDGYCDTCGLAVEELCTCDEFGPSEGKGEIQDVL